MDKNTNFVEYDGQLVDEDPAGPDRPPDSRCRPAFSGGSVGQVSSFAR